MNNQTIDLILASPFATLLVLVFVCYSITRLIVTDDFWIFSKPREWIKENFPPEDYVYHGKRPPHRNENQYKRLPNNRDFVVTEGHWLGELISCPWCSGFWISLGVWIGFLAEPEWVIVGAIPLALRAAVGWIAVTVGE